ncbi:MAG: patatin-like phospholipase family protein [Acidobacteriota bacterium]
MADRAVEDAPPGRRPRRIGLVLTGGGARAAYQAGLLCGLVEELPELSFRVLTGVSAGAINAAFLASRNETLQASAPALARLWTGLSPEKVFRVSPAALFGGSARWFLSLFSGGSPLAPRTRGLVDTSPLAELLRRELAVDARRQIPGIDENLKRGRLDAVALSTVDYGTGATVTWVQSLDFEPWQRPSRRSVETDLTVQHVMASAALPLLFPAIEVDGRWYGDGGIRMTVPLSPALHLDVDGILALSTRHRAPGQPLTDATDHEYPPPAQVAGGLMNAIFLDQLDQDARRLERFNDWIDQIPEGKWHGLRRISLEILRPSEDLGRLAAQFEAKLPRTFRFFTRGLGTRRTASPDILSMLMFQEDYMEAVVEIGRRDGREAAPRVERLLEGSPERRESASS